MPANNENLFEDNIGGDSPSKSDDESRDDKTLRDEEKDKIKAEIGLKRAIAASISTSNKTLNNTLKYLTLLAVLVVLLFLVFLYFLIFDVIEMSLCWSGKDSLFCPQTTGDFIEYAKYTTISLVSSITIIVSSALIGIRQALGNLVANAQKLGSSE